MEVDRSKFRREVVAPLSGQQFTIRRVRFKEFLTQVGGLPLALNATVKDALDKLRDRMASDPDPTADDRITKFYISKGVVEPQVWFDDPGQCPATAVLGDDLGSDLDFLASEIIQYSSEVSSLKGMENFFRGTGAGAPGPDGQEVRPAAVDAAAAEDI